MEKFLKDCAPRIRINTMRSTVGNASEEETELGLIVIYSNKTPAVECYRDPMDSNQKPDSGEAPEDALSGRGTVEPSRHRGESKGERGCCAPSAAASFQRSGAIPSFPSVLAEEVRFINY